MTTENGLIITPVTGGETRSYVTNPNEWMGNVHAETDPVTGRITSLTSGGVDVNASYTWAQAVALGAAGHAGLVILVSDVGMGAGSHWISDGANWRPLGGQVVLSAQMGSKNAPLDSITGVTFDVFTPPIRPEIPAGMLIPGVSEIIVEAWVHKIGANATGIIGATLGTSTTLGNNASLITASIAITTLSGVYINPKVSVGAATRFATNQYMTNGNSAVAGIVDIITNIDIAQKMYLGVFATSINAADQFDLIGFSVTLRQ